MSFNFFIDYWPAVLKQFLGLYNVFSETNKCVETGIRILLFCIISFYFSIFLDLYVVNICE